MQGKSLFCYSRHHSFSFSCVAFCDESLSERLHARNSFLIYLFTLT